MAIRLDGDWHSPAPFWQNGPAPASFYNFPGTAVNSATSFSQRSQ